MKKGLNVTLMTVAIAMMALQVMAKAPVIGDIKSPIVGSNEGITAATPFVYPDAFDITAAASDDTTDQAHIRWSYWYSGAEVYRINNVNRVTVNDAAINNPVAGQKINGATTDPLDGDADAATITIRNVLYAPIGGGGGTPSYSGIGDIVTVTLFASDGTTYTLQENGDVLFYTDNGGNNRLSGAGTFSPVVHETAFPSQSPITWTWTRGTGGTINSSTSAGTAVCIDAGLTGDNYATWSSNLGYFSVAKNTVYRIRARINGSQATAGHTPFADIYLSNFDGVNGFNLFGGDFMIFDNEGGANAPILKTSTSGTTYQWYWCPASVSNAVYNASAVWDAGNATDRQMQLVFRVIDYDSLVGATGELDSGSLCLNDVTIDSIPYGDLAFQQVYATPGTLSASNCFGSSIFGVTGYDAGRIKISEGNIGGVNDSKLSDYGSAAPGDATIDYDNLSSLTDNFPMAWEADTLYQISWTMSAVDAGSETAPLDAIIVGMDTPAFEFIINCM